MGMFDDVLYEAKMPLPDGFQGKTFQTKKFGCDMVQWRISEDGRLMQPLDTEGEPASFLTHTARYRDSHFHGWMNFYTLINKHPTISWVGPGNPGEWHGYRAKFTEGQLVTIEMDYKTQERFAAQRDGKQGDA